MLLDPSAVGRLLEPLARGPGELADVFVERRREVVHEWRDGEIVATRETSVDGLAARWRRRDGERLAAASRIDESALREVLRELDDAHRRVSPPLRAGREPTAEREPPPSAERWRRRIAAALARGAPRHGFRFTLAEILREVFPSGAAPASHARRLVSLDGTFTAASRRGDERRRFSFHGPDADTLGDELRAALVRAAEPRDAAVPCPEGDADAVLAAGCAAVLFHEILSHPLEGPAASPLTGLADARLAVADLDVRDEAARLDLFGGYETDDEGIRPRSVKLLDAGRLAGRLTARGDSASGRDVSNGHGRRAEPGDAPLPRGSNLVVAPGNATHEDIQRRLGNGLWIEELEAGSVELASGSFRLRFPRARRVRRGRLADELGPGLLAGDILAALKGVETGMSREAHTYRALGWCAREGQVVPVQGEAPDVLVRGLAVRALP